MFSVTKPHQVCVQKQLCHRETAPRIGAAIPHCYETLQNQPRWLICLIVAQVLFFTGHISQAQIDPSSALLLNGSARSSSRDNGVGSGRYTVRPRSDATNPAPSRNSRSTKSVETPVPTQSHLTPAETTNGSGYPTPVQVVTPVVSPPSASPVAVVKSAPIVMDVSSGAAPQPATGPNATPATRDATRNANKESTKDATGDADVSTGNGATDGNSVSAENRSEAAAQAEDDAIREQVARDQEVIRKATQNNLLDISFSAGYLYNDSSSTYSFRKYSTAAPAVIGDAHIWLSPEFGVGGSYLTTLSGSLPDGSHPSRVVPTTQQTFTLGIRYRDYFTHDLTYPYLIWGADYYQYHLSVPQDAQSRADLYSTGAKFSILGVFPGRRSYAWNLGFGLLPKMYHHEGSNSAGFRSGGHADANSVEILIGGRWQLSPSSSMFWRVTYQIEKDVFTGQASIPDPSSHTTPTGVSVTNSSVFLQMGYGWGN